MQAAIYEYGQMLCQSAVIIGDHHPAPNHSTNMDTSLLVSIWAVFRNLQALSAIEKLFVSL